MAQGPYKPFVPKAPTLNPSKPMTQPNPQIGPGTRVTIPYKAPFKPNNPPA